MKVDKEVIDDLVAKKLLKVSRSIRYPELSVLKYSHECFYKKKFSEHPFLLECRGMVIDDDYNVVIHPFTKVFNRNETPDSDIDRDSPVILVEKINGFMGVATLTEKYGWIYSTTGSLDSKYCDYVKEMLEPYVDTLADFTVFGESYIFEICHKDDPHIIEQEVGAYLIGMRMKNGKMAYEESLDSIAGWVIGCMRPKTINLARFSDAIPIVKTCRHEGYMVRELYSDKIIKMKSPYYLTLKMFARKKDLFFLVDNPQKKEDTLSTIEEEFHPLVNYISQHVELFQDMDEQERLDLFKKFLENS